MVAEDVFDALDAESAAQWAAYRAEVAGFFLRKFDPGSQLTAVTEANGALRLNPQNPEAETIRERILSRQVPSGLAGDLDLAHADRQAAGASAIERRGRSALPVLGPRRG